MIPGSVMQVLIMRSVEPAPTTSGLVAGHQSVGGLECLLASGALSCPGCGGPLGPWGFARERVVRTLTASLLLRPRRARCRQCLSTHVLLDAACLPRRRDGAEVIGRALLEHAAGRGHRPIAAQLQRPAATVRGWLRAAKGQAQALRACATRWAWTLSPALGPIPPAGSALGDAVEAVAQAARAWVLRFGPSRGAWELAGVMCGGGLLSGPLRGPPGFSACARARLP